MRNVSLKADTLIGSEIIKLGNEINQKIRDGQSIYNLTIGDFNPQLFPIPGLLKDHIVSAYLDNQTNYPPADGIPELKKAVQQFLVKNEGIEFSDDEVMIASGGRPIIHAIYNAIVDPNDKVLYPIPSWNNNHYCHLTDAQRIEVETTPDDGFMPHADSLAPHLKDVVLLALCSPLNPTGTTIRRAELEKICDLVIEENKRRAGNSKPLYVLFDQMYWMLMADGVSHFNPISLCPAMKPYTLFVDGISKSFAATGVRVGWGMGPAEVISKMKSIIGHIGAWAPKAEQVATANLLKDEAGVNAYIKELKAKINSRFDKLFNGFEALRLEGYPVQIIKPEGAIYLSVQISILGKINKSGKRIETTADITQFLLEEAQLAIVPFTAFGCAQGTDWYRISIGTLNEDDIPELLAKLKHALSQLK